MTSHKKTTSVSKFLSLVLRHKPETIGLTLDEGGWADVEQLMDRMSDNGTHLTFELLDEIVQTNDKKRFLFNEDKTRIKANQGHSIDIEHGFSPQVPPEILYHGTARRHADSILKSGLVKRQRHHVHLSADTDTALKVGQRHGKPVVFEVMSGLMHEKGMVFYCSENGVWLTDHVPPDYLKLG